MLSGFFDDTKEEEHINKNKQSTEKKSNLKTNKDSHQNYPSKNKDHTRETNDKSKSYPKRIEKSNNESFKRRSEGKPIKKYPSPPRPPLPFSSSTSKSSTNTKSYSQSKSAPKSDRQPSKPEMLPENFVMDRLLAYQKNILDNISNFRFDSVKQIDLMMNEIDKISYSKYTHKKKHDSH